ncbi:DUF4304 domain-containing protein [Rhizobium fabae]|uniref:DUF4304 domain-containing protein n=1 Tax=Rhizobium fabae TaxID=573179 RepID=A0A7W6FI47_9HYPH|nr:DUF4304 domain-containing protein [Rhizobium fabae]MBB3914823.1 hypothetical protein [Rhizobium fabae]RUM14293.1 DUF4304 domain-containing protein [Rhizobium fabae]RUM14711.1 DUF4304 domain-containing protein [Rhizobium fabae]
MNKSAFLKLLATHLYPVLRAEGFKGSGQTLRRIQAPVVHVFNVQSSRDGSHCYLNLGAHLTFLPWEGGSSGEPNLISEAHCVFRDRMQPPPGPGHGWSYCSSPQEAEENVRFIVSEWERTGRAFFQRYTHYPDCFKRLLESESPERISPRAALHLARIAVELSDQDRARTFIKSGLAQASERATILKSELMSLAQKMSLDLGRQN